MSAAVQTPAQQATEARAEAHRVERLARVVYRDGYTRGHKLGHRLGFTTGWREGALCGAFAGIVGCVAALALMWRWGWL